MNKEKLYELHWVDPFSGVYHKRLIDPADYPEGLREHPYLYDADSLIGTLVFISTFVYGSARCFCSQAYYNTYHKEAQRMTEALKAREVYELPQYCTKIWVTDV